MEEIVGVVSAFGPLVVSCVQSAEIERGEISLGNSHHLVVKLVRDDGFTGQQPEEWLGEATGVNNCVRVVISINNLVVGLAWGYVEGHEALAGRIRAVAITNDTFSLAKISILVGVVDDEVASWLEVGVLGSCANSVVSLEELALYVLLFIPSAHVSGTIKVGEGGGVVAFVNACEEVGDWHMFKCNEMII